ncbi:hypothetical protein BDW68DRAFT_152165 [Aspergillus falconensis]
MREACADTMICPRPTPLFCRHWEPAHLWYRGGRPKLCVVTGMTPTCFALVERSISIPAIHIIGRVPELRKLIRAEKYFLNANCIKKQVHSKPGIIKAWHDTEYFH